MNFQTLLRKGKKSGLPTERVKPFVISEKVG